MLDSGVCTSVSEIGDAENISKSYLHQAGHVQQPDLAGRTHQAMMLEQLERPLLALWEEQWRLLR